MKLKRFFMVVTLSFAAIQSAAFGYSQSEEDLFKSIEKAFESGNVPDIKSGSHAWIGECVHKDTSSGIGAPGVQIRSSEEFLALIRKRPTSGNPNPMTRYNPGFGANTPEEALEQLTTAYHTDYYNDAISQNQSLVQKVDGTTPIGDGGRGGWTTLKGKTQLRQGKLGSKAGLLYISKTTQTSSEDSRKTLSQVHCFFEEKIFSRPY